MRTITVGGYTIGTGTDVSIMVEGTSLHAAPDLKADVHGNAADHGAAGGLDLLRSRPLRVKVHIEADTSSDAKAIMRTLAAAWQPEGDQWFEFTDDDGDWAYYGRTRPAGFDERHLSVGVLDGELRFAATDPFLYSGTEHSESTGRAEPGAGFDIPFDIPFSIPASTSTGVVSAPNAGTAPAHWMARLDGPLVGPKIRHLGSGDYLELSANGGLTIAAGQYALISSRDGSVLLGGTADRRVNLRLPESQWWRLDPDANAVELTADSGAGSMTLDWRDAWW